MRYPFRTCMKQFIMKHSREYSPAELEEMDHDLSILDILVERLKKRGRISTTDPRKFTPDDIEQMFKRFRSGRISHHGIEHFLFVLNLLCDFAGNTAVKQFEDTLEEGWY